MIGLFFEVQTRPGHRNQYLDLAASLINVGTGEQVSDNVIRLISTLLGEGEAARDAALAETGLA